jgi:hypothetical protein
MIARLAMIASLVALASSAPAWANPVLQHVSFDPWLSGTVQLTWYWSSGGPLKVTVERTGPNDEKWEVVGTYDGGPYFTVEYGDHIIGARYGYRLYWNATDGHHRGGEAWVEIPGAYVRIIGFGSSPSGGPIVWLNLESTAPATVDVFDVSGRRVGTSGPFSFEAGRRAVAVDAFGPLHSGVYVIRLHQADKTVTKKAAFLRGR